MRKQQSNPSVCNAEGCNNLSRSLGLCPKHYKQVLRHGRLTPDREHRTGCRINGCGNTHKARGYCAKHYKELMGRGRIENNGHIKDPFCSLSDCNNIPARRGLCEEHYEYYLSLYVENGYTWKQVDHIIVLYNQRLLFNRNRISLIRKIHQEMLANDTPDKETEISQITMDDLLDDECFDNEHAEGVVMDYLEDDDLFEEILSEAECYEGGNLWEDKL